MGMLVVLGVVADVANSHRVSSDDLFVTEILPPSDSLHKLSASFAL